MAVTGSHLALDRIKGLLPKSLLQRFSGLKLSK
jgi:hypothetical protein